MSCSTHGPCQTRNWPQACRDFLWLPFQRDSEAAGLVCFRTTPYTERLKKELRNGRLRQDSLLKQPQKGYRIGWSLTHPAHTQASKTAPSPRSKDSFPLNPPFKQTQKGAVLGLALPPRATDLPFVHLETEAVFNTRSSSEEVNILGYQLFSVVYFSRGTLPKKRKR